LGCVLIHLVAATVLCW